MKMVEQAEVIICGAGIAGVSAAHFLAVQEGMKGILLADQNSPLSLTSDMSTESYRNWWPGPDDAMVRLMERSIDLMEELAGKSNNVFNLNRRGYLYCSSDLAKVPGMYREAEQISRLGAGPLRVHTSPACLPSYQPASADEIYGQPTGADLLLDPTLIRKHFPFLSTSIIAALHVRRAGWLSAQQLGMYLLQQARYHGVQFLNEQVTGVEFIHENEFKVTTASGRQVKSPIFVNAAGPFLKPVGQMLGVDLPVHHELHLKINFKDSAGVMPRHAPLVIYTDPQTINWSVEEREFLEQDSELHWLLNVMPAGVHTRPEGGIDSQMILILWEYRTQPVEPTWPVPADPYYPEIALHGLERMIPGMRQYAGKFSKPHVDGGYYTKTHENRPLIGRLPLAGAYIFGALSGFGIMAACGGGELLAKHILGAPLPDYAPAFSLERYQDSGYLESLKNLGDYGQL